MKEKDRLLLRKQKEAKEYETKYHAAESKRIAAISNMHELTLVESGVEPIRKAGKHDSKAELRKMLHLAQKEKEVGTLDLLCMNCM